jgi:hypothetical protein
MTDQTTTLTEADEHTLLTAAYGTVVLMTAANPAPIASAKSSTAASLAMTSATGLTGHVFAIKTKVKDLDLGGGNTAEIAETCSPRSPRPSSC